MSVPTTAQVLTDVPVEQFVDGVVEANPISTQNLNTTQSGPVFSAEDLNRVREQEKAKLYPELERLKNELRTRDEAEAARVQEEARKREQAEIEARRAAEESLDVKDLLKARETEWETRFNQQAEQIAAIEAERQRSEALLQMEQQYQELQSYRQVRLDEVADQIMPELRDLVAGNSADEIEASIANLIDRTSRIVDNVKQATQSARQQMPGARVTYPANGPLDTDSGNQLITPEQVAGMSLAEYSKHRERLLGRSSSAKGLFG